MAVSNAISITGDSYETLVLAPSHTQSDALSLVAHSGFNQRDPATVVIRIRALEALELAQWLIGWSKEHVAPCFTCKKSGLISEMKRVGQDWEHPDCLEARWKK